MKRIKVLQNRLSIIFIAVSLITISNEVIYSGCESRILDVSDTITRKTRVYKGKLQYRRWNVTRKKWTDARWITIVPSKKRGWVKEGKTYYYYSARTGKLVTNKLIKIGKYKYGFDKQGRSVRSKAAKIDGFVYHFDKKGHALIQEKKTGGIYCCIDKPTNKIIYTKNTLRISQKSNDRFIAKEISKTGNTFVVFKKQIKVKAFRSLKKGDKIQVFSDGHMTESDLMMYDLIFKILKVE